ncbi:MAG: hypothetical protein IT340_19880 [Chloroflexi bacterium]|nr:hypothetical protein [Chloroflexota bacterium]
MTHRDATTALIPGLLGETIRALHRAGWQPSHVEWVGSRDGSIVLTWAEFAALTHGVTYDAGYGAQEVASDLVVVGAGWWLERYSHAGCERWAYRCPPVLAEQRDPRPITTLVCDGERFIGWKTIVELNPTSEEDAADD